MSRWKAGAWLVAAMLSAPWCVGCGSDEGPAPPPPPPKEVKAMTVSGRVVKRDGEMPVARIRFTPLTPHGHSAEVPADVEGFWRWGAPQGRYRVEVLVDGEVLLTKELDLTKPENPDIELALP